VTAPRRHLHVRLAAAACALALAAVACSSSRAAAPTTTASRSTTAASAATTAAGAGGVPSTSAAPDTVPDAFYVPPSPLPDGPPGTVIRTAPIAAPAGSRGWAVLHTSTALDGSRTAVSGVVYVPDAPAPGGGPRPVLAWAHGTTGLGDACASSKAFADESAAELAIVAFVTGQGIAFVATDYQGLGTPGPHPYLVNQIEGRNVLDSVRTLQAMPGSGVTPASKVVVWGHSQGGGAAAFAAELQPTYAPDLAVVGAMVGAPAADFGGLASAAPAGGTRFGFVVMALAGYAAAYPDVELGTLLTVEGRRVASSIETQCSDEILGALRAVPTSSLLTPAVATDAALAARLKENSAGYVTTGVPIFLYHGDADTVVPPDASRRILERYCAIGVNASRKVYAGADHVSVILAAVGDLGAWVQARLAGQPATPTC
jgi:alpha-beta hydrolase superfamily lysophospholipase